MTSFLDKGPDMPKAHNARPLWYVIRNNRLVTLFLFEITYQFVSVFQPFSIYNFACLFAKLPRPGDSEVSK